MIEKRRHPRRPLQLPVRVFPRAGEPWSSSTVDLSVGGMFVEGNKGLVFNQEIDIEIDLPKIGPTRLPAVVRWLRAEGFGVQFGLLGARHTHALATLVANAP